MSKKKQITKREELDAYRAPLALVGSARIVVRQVGQELIVGYVMESGMDSHAVVHKMRKARSAFGEYKAQEHDNGN